MGDDDSNIEIIDVENYKSDKLLVFNHQILVMEVLRRVNESGSHELRPGWFNEKTSNDGNISRTYVEDTRKKFIECVKTAMMTMACDYDKEADGFVDQCVEELEEEKIKLLKSQWSWYEGLTPKFKQQFAGKINQTFFNSDLGWYLKFIETEVECFRAIAQELNSLTKRLDFYQTEDFEV